MNAISFVGKTFSRVRKYPASSSMMKSVYSIMSNGRSYGRMFSSSSSAFPKGSNQLVNVTAYVSGQNQPGIVYSFSEHCVHKCGANIGTARMAELGNDFAIIAELTIEQQNIDKLSGLLSENFKEPVYSSHVKLSSKEGYLPQAGTRPLKISIVGPDAKGLLKEVSEYFTDQGINISDLQARVIPGDHIGYNIFEADITISLPANNERDTLSHEITSICHKIGLDCTISDGI